MAAAAAVGLLLAGCTDTSPAGAPSSGTSAPVSGGGAESGSSGHHPTGPAHPTTHPTHPTHPTTAPPTSGHYDPSKCQPGLLCSSGS